MNIFENVYFLIPARKGSKGVPYKNRKLFDKTAEIVPSDLSHRVVVSTNDKAIEDKALAYGFQVLRRPDVLSSDSISIRDAVFHMKESIRMPENSTIVMLYLTYPERTWLEVKNICGFYFKQRLTSLLCRIEVTTHPFLCLVDTGGGKGKQLIKHNLYRRQDYPKCFEISHYVCIFNLSALSKLNLNLYCDDTVYYQIDRPIDVDTSKDLEKYYDKNNI